MWSQTVPLDLTLSVWKWNYSNTRFHRKVKFKVIQTDSPERSNSRSFKFICLYHKRVLGHILLLKTNREVMGNPSEPLHLTFSDLERLNSRPLSLEGLHLVMEVRPNVTVVHH